MEGRPFLFLNAPDPGDSPLSLRLVATMLRRLPLLALELRRERVYTVNAHFPTRNLFSLALLKRFGLWRGQLVLSFHGSDVAALRACKAWQLIASQTDAVTCCSAALADRLRENGIFRSCRVSVVHNGIDGEYFATRGSLRSPLVTGPYLLSVGNFVAHKGQDTLIDAFSLIAKRQGTLRLVLVGGSDNGIWLANLRAKVAKLGLEERVSFFENQPHSAVAAFMSGACAFVHSARMEAFGLVIIEAAACGLPVIATRVGGIPEIISSESLGVLVEPDSPDELAEAIESMLADSERMHSVGEQLHNHIKVRFSNDTMIAGYRACFKIKT